MSESSEKCRKWSLRRNENDNQIINRPYTEKSVGVSFEWQRGKVWDTKNLVSYKAVSSCYHLHHCEPLIVCVSCFPLNSPFILFISSQRASTLRGAQLLYFTIVLNYTEAEEPVTACSQKTDLSGRTCCSFRGCVQRVLKCGDGACPWAELCRPPALRMLLWRRPWPLTPRGREEFPHRDQYMITRLCI